MCQALLLLDHSNNLHNLSTYYVSSTVLMALYIKMV